MDVETFEAIEVLCSELAGVERRLAGQIVRSESELRAEIAVSRVHAKVLTERVQDDVRLVAEAVAVLTVKVDALAR